VKTCYLLDRESNTRQVPRFGKSEVSVPPVPSYIPL